MKETALAGWKWAAKKELAGAMRATPNETRSVFRYHDAIHERTRFILDS